MAEEGSQHAACVDAWLERAAGAGTDGLLDGFEKALAALWRRAQVTLGDVTLAAIGDRVLHDAAESFPPFASLTVDAGGLVHGQELRERAPGLPASELRAGVRFVLVHFLTVLGNLTADILTPDLHAELGGAAPADSNAPNRSAPGVSSAPSRTSKEQGR